MSVRLPWLRRDRAEVLAAIGLVVSSGEAIPVGLRRIASEFPGRGSFFERMAKLAERGMDLPEVLLSFRLINRGEANFLLFEEVDTVEAYAAVSEFALLPRRSATLHTWFPVYAALIVGIIPVCGARIVDALFGNSFSRIFDELGIRVPAITEWTLVQPAAEAIPLGFIAVGIFSVAFFAVRQIPFVNCLLRLWSLRVQRAVIAGDLVRAALVGLGASGKGIRLHPLHQLWSYRVLGMLDKGARLKARDPNLVFRERLVQLGLLVENGGQVDWVASIRDRENELAAALRESNAIAGWLLFFLSVTTIGITVASPFLGFIHPFGWL